MNKFHCMLLENRNSRRIYFLDNIRRELDNVGERLWRSRDRIEDNDVNHVPIRNDEKKAIEPLIESGYEYIGMGCGRIVLRLPDEGELNKFIVKIARFGNDPVSIGMWQNNNEISLWNNVSNKSYPITPICDWQEKYAKWLIMPYGKPVEELNKTKEEKEQIISDAVDRLANLTELSNDEFEPVNFVIHNDEPVLADYGRHSYTF